jgi:hypothetical protein
MRGKAMGPAFRDLVNGSYELERQRNTKTIEHSSEPQSVATDVQSAPLPLSTVTFTRHMGDASNHAVTQRVTLAPLRCYRCVARLGQPGLAKNDLHIVPTGAIHAKPCRRRWLQK